jgi:anti-sigma28 factor (negative regulator of flagellin synthesis)
VREEKVAEIKTQVSDGTYSVPASVLARNMLESADQQP